MSRVLTAMAATTVIVSSFALVTNVALGHERRSVGPYTFEVGWISEPPLVGLLNGLDLTVTETSSGKGVTELARSLRAEAIVGGGAKSLSLTLEAVEGQPGEYLGRFVPTKEGDYIFHIAGTIGTAAVDERFESGPNTFDVVQSTGPLQFPDTVPSNTDLAARLDSLETLVIVGIAVAILALLASAGGLLMRRR